ncbi:hypothetical protein PFISCL1PPCAC_17117, partial [Pristionchus fissidentatus]
MVFVITTSILLCFSMTRHCPIESCSRDSLELSSLPSPMPRLLSFPHWLDGKRGRRRSFGQRLSECSCRSCTAGNWERRRWRGDVHERTTCT